MPFAPDYKIPGNRIARVLPQLLTAMDRLMIGIQESNARGDVVKLATGSRAGLGRLRDILQGFVTGSGTFFLGASSMDRINALSDASNTVRSTNQEMVAALRSVPAQISILRTAMRDLVEVLEDEATALPVASLSEWGSTMRNFACLVKKTPDFSHRLAGTESEIGTRVVGSLHRVGRTFALSAAPDSSPLKLPAPAPKVGVQVDRTTCAATAALPDLPPVTAPGATEVVGERRRLFFDFNFPPPSPRPPPPPPVIGCIHSISPTYNPLATLNNGCYASCQDTEALNYDPAGDWNDVRLCVMKEPGCMDPIASNYNPSANVPQIGFRTKDDDGEWITMEDAPCRYPNPSGPPPRPPSPPPPLPPSPSPPPPSPPPPHPSPPPPPPPSPPSPSPPPPGPPEPSPPPPEPPSPSPSPPPPPPSPSPPPCPPPPPPPSPPPPQPPPPLSPPPLPPPPPPVTAAEKLKALASFNSLCESVQAALDSLFEAVGPDEVTQYTELTKAITNRRFTRAAGLLRASTLCAIDNHPLCAAAIPRIEHGCEIGPRWIQPPTTKDARIEVQVATVQTSTQTVAGKSWTVKALDMHVALLVDARASCSLSTEAAVSYRFVQRNVQMEFYASASSTPSDDLAIDAAAALHVRQNGQVVVRPGAVERWWQHHSTLWVDSSALGGGDLLADDVCAQIIEQPTFNASQTSVVEVSAAMDFTGLDEPLLASHSKSPASMTLYMGGLSHRPWALAVEPAAACKARCGAGMMPESLDSDTPLARVSTGKSQMGMCQRELKWDAATCSADLQLVPQTFMCLQYLLWDYGTCTITKEQADHRFARCAGAPLDDDVTALQTWLATSLASAGVPPARAAQLVALVDCDAFTMAKATSCRCVSSAENPVSELRSIQESVGLSSDARAKNRAMDIVKKERPHTHPHTHTHTHTSTHTHPRLPWLTLGLVLGLV